MSHMQAKEWFFQNLINMVLLTFRYCSQMLQAYNKSLQPKNPILSRGGGDRGRVGRGATIGWFDLRLKGPVML